MCSLLIPSLFGKLPRLNPRYVMVGSSLVALRRSFAVGAEVVAITSNAVITGGYSGVNRAQAIAAYEARRGKVESNCKNLSSARRRARPAFTTPRGLCDCTRTLRETFSGRHTRQHGPHFAARTSDGPPMGTTNGIDLSFDGTTLYVSEANSRKVLAYRLDGNRLTASRPVARAVTRCRAAR